MGLSAGLIDGLLLLPQDYRSSSPGGEGNSSEHSGERGERKREGTERKGEKDRGRARCGGGVSMKMERKIGEDRGKAVRKNIRRGEREKGAERIRRAR